MDKIQGLAVPKVDAICDTRARARDACGEILIRTRVCLLNPAVMGILISKYPDTREHALSSGDGSFRRYPDTRALVTMRGHRSGMWIS